LYHLNANKRIATKTSVPIMPPIADKTASFVSLIPSDPEVLPTGFPVVAELVEAECPPVVLLDLEVEVEVEVAVAIDAEEVAEAAVVELELVAASEVLVALPSIVDDSAVVDELECETVVDVFEVVVPVVVAGGATIANSGLYATRPTLLILALI